MRIILAFVSTLFLVQGLFAQSPRWIELPNAPISGGRFEDIFAVNPQTIWIVNYGGIALRTTNSGTNWSSQNLYFELRSIGFFSSSTGLIGTLTTGHILLRTTNGGLSWSEVTNISGTPPLGICGIYVLDSLTAFGCGMYTGPIARVIKTTDRGLSWISRTIDTTLAKSLVDCYFWTGDSGIAVGGFGLSGRSVVLLTSNGGINWSRVYLSTRTGEWCWKISFATRLVGYASIERFSGGGYFLKTTDGGFSWQDGIQGCGDAQGIGFVNANTGWIGGWCGSTIESTNGGASWHPAGFGFNINRFRFLNDTLGYAVGRTVYKYTTEPLRIRIISDLIPEDFKLSQNYPNPFNPATKIIFAIPKKRESELVSLKIYDIQGREVETLVNESLKPGEYEVDFAPFNLSSGAYIYELKSGVVSFTRRMILLK